MARTIGRREPVITLGPLRYRGRSYKEGDHLDRRRVRMPHSKLVRLVREGVCILAKDLDTDKLNNYGYVYDGTSRYHLKAYKAPELKMRLTSDAILEKLTEDVTTVKLDGEEIGSLEKIKKSKLVNVKLGGDVISKAPMKIDDAIKLLIGTIIKKGE